jgi:hypothetical protein
VQAYLEGILPRKLCDWVIVVDPGKTNMIIYVNSMLSSYQICLPDIHTVESTRNSAAKQILHQHQSEHCLLSEAYLDLHTIFREVALLPSSDCNCFVKFLPYFIP